MEITNIKYTDSLEDGIIIEPANMIVAWPLNNEDVREDVEAWLAAGNTIQPADNGMPPLPRDVEIITRLREIDLESIRPLRAIKEGTDTTFDHERLTALENEAKALRDELAAL